MGIAVLDLKAECNTIITMGYSTSLEIQINRLKKPEPDPSLCKILLSIKDTNQWGKE